MNDFPKRYEFRGQAITVASSLAGSMVRNGCASLPSVGGVIESTTPAIEFPSTRGSLTVGPSSARVSGNLTGSILNPRTTARSEAHVKVTGFHFGEIVSVGLAEACLTSEDPRNRGELVFTQQKATLERVRVMGATLYVELDEIFSGFPTKHSLIETFETDREFRKANDHRFYTGGRQFDSLFQTTPQIQSMVVVTVVKRLAFDGDAPAGVSIQGSRVNINGVGAITFGELRIGEKERGLTMVRIELDGTGRAVTSEISTLGAAADSDGVVEVGGLYSGPPRCWP